MGHKQEVARENQERFLAFEENAERAGLPDVCVSGEKKRPRDGEAHPRPLNSGQKTRHTQPRQNCTIRWKPVAVW